MDFWTTRLAQQAPKNPQAAPPPSEPHWIIWLKEYWFAIVGAFIGSFLAIIFTKRDQRTKERADRAKCVARLVRCLSFNVDRLKQAKTQFTKSVIPNYPMDTEQLNDWIAQAGDLLDEKLMEAVDRQRYQLDHVSSKILAVSQYNLHIAVAANPTRPDRKAGKLETDRPWVLLRALQDGRVALSLNGGPREMATDVECQYEAAWALLEPWLVWLESQAEPGH